MINKRNNNNIAVGILAGGLGSRLGEITASIPKPLVKINKLPILVHIMKIYLNYNFSNFFIALGYKGEEIIKYFIKNNKINANIKSKIKSGFTITHYIDKKKCTITFVDTGLKTMTGGRVKRLAKVIPGDNFMLTYGDGLANVNIKKLLDFHYRNKKIVTVTAVNPPARFGEIKLKGPQVKNFSEKKRITSSWINGGFFVINKKFSKYIRNDKEILERYPLEKVANINQLVAFKHRLFWQCMDTKRDKDILEKMLKEKR